MSLLTSRLPWTSTQARAAVLADAVGAVVIGAAALGSAGEANLSSQVLWLNLAVLGLGVVCASHGALILVARRAIGQRIRVLLPNPTVATPSASGVHSESSEWIWISGTRRAHHGGCLLVAGKATVTVSTAQIRAEALQRCEACG